MPRGHVEVTVLIKNGSAVEALARSIELIEGLVDDLPWRSDAWQALQQLRTAAEGLVIERT